MIMGEKRGSENWEGYVFLIIAKGRDVRLFLGEQGRIF